MTIQACPNFSNEVPHIFGLSDTDNSLLSFLKGIASSVDDISTADISATDISKATVQQHDHVSTATTSAKPKRISTTQKPETKSTKSDPKSDSEPELDLTFRSIQGLANISVPLALSKGNLCYLLL